MRPLSDIRHDAEEAHLTGSLGKTSYSLLFDVPALCEEVERLRMLTEANDSQSPMEDCAMREPAWDETFWELMLDDIKDVIEDAKKSRRKIFEQAVTMQSMRETITVTVKKVRR